MTTTIHHGNNLHILPTIPDHTFDAIITDPPYELGFMGKQWDASGIAYNATLWAECLRVLKPGGHLLAFGGTRTYHRMVCAIEDAGFEIRDSIHWIYGSGFPKSLNLHEEWEGWGTALKPAHEPIVLARKPLIGTVIQNVLTYNTGALNIDGCRIQREPSDTSHAGNRTATFGTQNTTSGGDGSGGWEQNDLGRWPANIILDGDSTVIELFLETASTGKATKSGHRKGGGNGNSFGLAGIKHAPDGYNDGGSASRFFNKTPFTDLDEQSFFYCAKPSKAERNAGLDDLESKRHADRVKDDGVGGDNPRNRSNNAKKNFHPTVKPLALMRHLIRLVTPPNGHILDPFAGSGTTLTAATLEGHHSTGIELTDDYIPIIKARTQWAANQPPQLL